MSKHDDDTCPHLVRASLLEAENASLKAEVERLRIAGGESEPRFVFLSDYRHLKAERDNLKAEVDRLRASSFVTAVPVEHYERLVKAGDAMAEWFTHNDCRECRNDCQGWLPKAWNAAKEGKPSV